MNEITSLTVVTTEGKIYTVQGSSFVEVQAPEVDQDVEVDVKTASGAEKTFVPEEALPSVDNATAQS